MWCCMSSAHLGPLALNLKRHFSQITLLTLPAGVRATQLCIDNFYKGRTVYICMKVSNYHYSENVAYLPFSLSTDTGSFENHSLTLLNHFNSNPPGDVLVTKRVQAGAMWCMALVTTISESELLQIMSCYQPAPQGRVCRFDSGPGTNAIFLTPPKSF